VPRRSAGADPYLLIGCTETSTKILTDVFIFGNCTTNVCEPPRLRVVPSYCGGLISQTVRLNRSPVGAVSLIVTVVPDTATDPFNRCTQYVSPTLDAI